jgi:hypothetical protein
MGGFLGGFLSGGIALKALDRCAGQACTLLMLCGNLDSLPWLRTDVALVWPLSDQA